MGYLSYFAPLIPHRYNTYIHKWLLVRPMTDVFISYSRKDTDFVRRLFDALKAQGRGAASRKSAATAVPLVQRRP